MAVNETETLTLKGYSMQKIITIDQVNAILQRHGITDIYDGDTGSCLADDIGVFDKYGRDDVFAWLGY